MDALVMGELHPQWAAWTALDRGRVSFSEDWRGRGLPRLWLGEDRLQLKSLKRVPVIEFAFHSGYCRQRGGILFFVSEDRLIHAELRRGVYLAGDFNGWADAIGKPDWRLQPMRLGKVRGYGLKLAVGKLPIDRFSCFKWVTGHEHWLPVPEDAPNIKIDERGIRNYRYSPHRTGLHLFDFKTPLPLAQSEDRKVYFDSGSKVFSTPLNPGVFLKKLGSKAELGAVVEGESTEFAFFAPRAAMVHLFVFSKPEGPEGKPVPMEADSDGVWHVRIDRNLHGSYYHFSIIGEDVDEIGHFDANVRVPDPYAKVLHGPLGPGVVAHASVFQRDRPAFHPPHWHDLVILEAHVRDLNANAPVEMTPAERAGFAGLEKYVRSKEFYPYELGVNAVELQPIHIYDTQDAAQYAWGYMPMNYFCPATQFASDPADPLSAVRECRRMIDAFHDRGLAVLLDVVYNHIGEPNFFQYIDKEYYFLLAEDGSYENHSGCGNTFDADTPMFRRLMRDSLAHWIQAYDVDGFRFDLGELIGVETLSWLEGELKKIKPGIVLIAEPWSFRGHIARELSQTGFASWNDGYREFMRRYLVLEEGAEHLQYYLRASQPEWSRFPAQSVNYVASHDDRCWIDKITENANHDGHLPTANDRRRTHLMVSLLMMSLGIPMLAAGEDAMKSKGGVNNTYLRGDLNAIPYNRRAEYSGTAGYFQRWVAFRRSKLGRLLRLHSTPNDGYFRFFSDGALFGMIVNADYSHGCDRLIYVCNPAFGYGEVRFDGLEKANLKQLCDTECWGEPYLDTPRFHVAGGRILVPALSCGLFFWPAESC